MLQADGEHSTATADISRNVQQVAGGAGIVTRTMTQLNGAVVKTAGFADQVVGASGEMTSKTEMLRREVDRFLASIAAA